MVSLCLPAALPFLGRAEPRFATSLCEKSYADNNSAQVTRRPLRVSRTVHRKVSSLDRVARVTLAEAAIEKESHAQAVDDPEEHQEGNEIKAEVKELQMPRDGEVLSRTQTRE